MKSTKKTFTCVGAHELVVDNFAGGGGASTAIEKALGRPVDIAINHDREAIAMHAMNHPQTTHLCEDVWDVDIKAVVGGRPVGLAWFSPDCKHFSKAKGGKPVEKRIRGLAWVALKWAGTVRPRIIMLENVEEFQTWGPVVAGQPCKQRKGRTFQSWVAQLRNLGYGIDWRELRACDYGAPTIRKRLFVVARCDGQPIVWPEATHGSGLVPYRTAAECIDWSLPCPSIFLSKEDAKVLKVKRPLAENTMRRIARGVKRYVIEAVEPFIVPIAHYDGTDRVHDIGKPLKTVTANPKGGSMALVTPYLTNLTHHGSDRNESVEEPFRTVTAARRGEKALVVPTLIQTGYGERPGQAPRVPGLDKPLGTTVAGAVKHALVAAHVMRFNQNGEGSSPAEPLDTVMAGAPRFGVVSAFLAQHNAGPHNEGKSGRPADQPVSTVSTSGSQQQVVASSLVKLRGTSRDGQPVDQPMATVSAGGTHIAEVRAFLMKYYGSPQDPRLSHPLHSITTKARFGVVLTLHGEDYVIADIGMRMLTPRELFRAQGFPDSYIIDRGSRACVPGDKEEGDQEIRLTKTAQIRMCGNSVSPYPAAALIAAQLRGRKAEVA